jgi:hypothetical protein
MSDCIYEDESFGALAKTLVDVTEPGSIVLCMHRKRYPEREHRFWDPMLRSFSWETVCTPVKSRGSESLLMRICALCVQITDDSPGNHTSRFGELIMYIMRRRHPE